MSRFYLLFLLVIGFGFSKAQNLNDNCENATDITSEIFNFEDWGSICNSPIGIIVESFGMVDDHVDHPTVDPSNYSSQDCEGYAPQTTDHYPDLWYKTTLQESGVIYFQHVFLYAGDTIQLATYFGQCGSLFQSQCFTLTWADTNYWQGITLEYYPHHAGDDFYLQVKVPPQYEDYLGMCFSSGAIGVLYYSFSYDRPAGSGGTTNTISAKKHSPIVLFPNPAHESIHIQADAPILTFSIRDLQGKIYKTGFGHEGRTTINTNDLNPGMYAIIVQTENGIGMSKFVKL